MKPPCELAVPTLVTVMDVHVRRAIICARMEGRQEGVVPLDHGVFLNGQTRADGAGLCCTATSRTPGYPA